MKVIFGFITIVLLASTFESCRSSFLSDDTCIMPNRLKYYREHRNEMDLMFKSALVLRKKFNYNRFCSYETLLDKKKISYSHTYMGLSGHFPPIWLLMSKDKFLVLSQRPEDFKLDSVKAKNVTRTEVFDVLNVNAADSAEVLKRCYWSLRNY